MKSNSDCSYADSSAMDKKSTKKFKMKDKFIENMTECKEKVVKAAKKLMPWKKKHSKKEASKLQNQKGEENNTALETTKGEPCDTLTTANHEETKTKHKELDRKKQTENTENDLNSSFNSSRESNNSITTSQLSDSNIQTAASVAPTYATDTNTKPESRNICCQANDVPSPQNVNSDVEIIQKQIPNANKFQADAENNESLQESSEISTINSNNRGRTTSSSHADLISSKSSETSIGTSTNTSLETTEVEERKQEENTSQVYDTALPPVEQNASCSSVYEFPSSIKAENVPEFDKSFSGFDYLQAGKSKSPDTEKLSAFCVDVPARKEFTNDGALYTSQETATGPSDTNRKRNILNRTVKCCREKWKKRPRLKHNNKSSKTRQEINESAIGKKGDRTKDENNFLKTQQDINESVTCKDAPFNKSPPDIKPRRPNAPAPENEDQRKVEPAIGSTHVTDTNTLSDSRSFCCTTNDVPSPDIVNCDDEMIQKEKPKTDQFQTDAKSDESLLKSSIIKLHDGERVSPIAQNASCSAAMNIVTDKTKTKSDEFSSSKKAENVPVFDKSFSGLDLQAGKIKSPDTEKLSAFCVAARKEFTNDGALYTGQETAAGPSDTNRKRDILERTVKCCREKWKKRPRLKHNNKFSKTRQEISESAIGKKGDRTKDENNFLKTQQGINESVTCKDAPFNKSPPDIKPRRPNAPAPENEDQRKVEPAIGSTHVTDTNTLSDSRSFCCTINDVPSPDIVNCDDEMIQKEKPKTDQFQTDAKSDESLLISSMIKRHDGERATLWLPTKNIETSTGTSTKKNDEVTKIKDSKQEKNASQVYGTAVSPIAQNASCSAAMNLFTGKTKTKSDEFSSSKTAENVPEFDKSFSGLDLQAGKIKSPDTEKLSAFCVDVPARKEFTNDGALYTGQETAAGSSDTNRKRNLLERTVTWCRDKWKRRPRLKHKNEFSERRQVINESASSDKSRRKDIESVKAKRPNALVPENEDQKKVLTNLEMESDSENEHDIKLNDSEQHQEYRELESTVNNNSVPMVIKTSELKLQETGDGRNISKCRYPDTVPKMEEKSSCESADATNDNANFVTETAKMPSELIEDEIPKSKTKTIKRYLRWMKKSVKSGLKRLVIFLAIEKSSEESCKGSSVGGFCKYNDNAVHWEDFEPFYVYKFNLSIGILRFEYGHGTCFRVGHERLVLTAYHVVKGVVKKLIRLIADNILFNSSDNTIIDKVATALGVNKNLWIFGKLKVVISKYLKWSKSETNLCENSNQRGNKLEDILWSYLKSTNSEIDISTLLLKLESVVSDDTMLHIRDCLTTAWKKVSVQFENEDRVHTFDYDIPFVDEYNDILLLKVSGTEELPDPVVLDTADLPHKTTIFGYSGDTKLKIDPNCHVYQCEKSLKAGVHKSIQYFIQESGENDPYIRKGFENIEDKVIIHASSSFSEGASGGPMARVDIGLRQPVASAMFQRGFPSFYYDPTSKFYRYSKAPESVKFEAGISMQTFEDLLLKSNKTKLKEGIFDKVKPSWLH